MRTSGRTTHVSHNAGIGAALMALSRHQPTSSSSSAPTPNFPSDTSFSAPNPVPTTRLFSAHLQSTSESSSDSDSPSESPSEDPSKNSSDSSSDRSENSSENSDEDSEVHVTFCLVCSSFAICCARLLCFCFYVCFSKDRIIIA